MIELILAFLPIILLLLLLTQGYVKAPPDHAYIISGIRKEPRVLIGRAGLKIPFFEQLDKLYLGQITVDIKTDEYIPTNDFINVMVDAVAKVRVAEDPERMKLAMRNFLNKEPSKIAADLQDSLQGNMREIIGTLTLRAINTDRDSFSDQVMTKASRDMEKLGIDILSCNIQNVTDEHGLIQDLGMDNTSKIRKDASIAKAEAERDIAIAKAAADRPPTTPGFWRRRKSPRKTMSLPSRRRSFRRLRIPRRQRRTPPMRFRSRNRKRRFRPPPSTLRLPGPNGRRNCAGRKLRCSSRLWKRKSTRRQTRTATPSSRRQQQI